VLLPPARADYSGGAARQLCHQKIRFAGSRKKMPMTAVAAENDVPGFEVIDDADGVGFLAIVAVGRSEQLRLRQTGPRSVVRICGSNAIWA
jgi:hypothetical protein